MPQPNKELRPSIAAELNESSNVYFLRGRCCRCCAERQHGFRMWCPLVPKSHCNIRPTLANVIAQEQAT